MSCPVTNKTALINVLALDLVLFFSWGGQLHAITEGDFG